MHNRIEVARWPVFALLLIGLIGCDEPEEQDLGQTEEGVLALGQSEVVERVSRGVAPGDRLLVLDGFDGTVRLDGTEEEDADLVFEKRARGEDDADARDVLDRIELEEQGDADRYEYTMTSDWPERSRVDVHGTVPRSTRLRTDFESGAVALSGIEGPIEVQHENGNVQVAGAAASVRVEIRNGNIEVGMQRVPQGAEIALTTSNGNLTLAMPDTASTQITAQTQAGDISTQEFDFESRRLEPRGAGARFEAQIGAGNATVDLRTENGSIMLRGDGVDAPIPADRMPVEPADTATDAPMDTVRPDTVPSDTVPQDTVPQDTVPPDTADTTLEDDTTGL